MDQTGDRVKLYTLQTDTVADASEAVLTPFYPDLKKKIFDSWKKLFRHHEDILSGNDTAVRSVQAGLWQIKKEWLI